MESINITIAESTVLLGWSRGDLSQAIAAGEGFHGITWPCCSTLQNAIAPPSAPRSHESSTASPPRAHELSWAVARFAAALAWPDTANTRGGEMLGVEAAEIVPPLASGPIDATRAVRGAVERQSGRHRRALAAR